MLSLILDTSGEACSLVLARGKTLLWEQTHPMKRGHDRALFPLLEEALTQEGVGFGDLSTIVAVVGPGSFTGLRIGIAAAQGLCLATKAQGGGVTAFEAMVGARSPLEPTLALIPTQTGAYYGQTFGPQEEQPCVLSQEDILKGCDARPGLRLFASQEDAFLAGLGGCAYVPVCARGAYEAMGRGIALKPLLPFYLRESTPVRKLQQ